MIQDEHVMRRPAKPRTNVLGYDHQPLDSIFAPRSVAVIGATEKAGSVGRTLLWNLISNPFGGTVFPINPKRESVQGIKAYASEPGAHQTDPPASQLA